MYNITVIWPFDLKSAVFDLIKKVLNFYFSTLALGLRLCVLKKDAANKSPVQTKTQIKTETETEIENEDVKVEEPTEERNPDEVELVFPEDQNGKKMFYSF